MARIPMTSGFTLIPEGEYVFRIFDVIYDEEYGKLEVKMVNAQAMTHNETFSLMDGNGEPNEKALNAFSYFAKTALNDFSLEDIDHTDLIDHYIRAEVVHTKMPSRKDPTKTVTFANLGDKFPADGFDTEPVPAALEKKPGGEKPKKKDTAASTQTPKPAAGNLDLDALLN